MAFPNATSTGSSAYFGEGVGTRKSSRNEYDQTTDDLPHKMHRMFLTNSRFEFSIPPFLQAPRVTERRFVLVEQCLNVPLWHIQVVPKAPQDSNEIQCSTLYLATHVEEVLKVLSLDWQSSKVHVLLPDYMTQSDSPALAKCLVIWEYRTADGDTRPHWLFETNIGTFADPSQDDGVARKDLKKFALRWQAAEKQT
jgi:hypothetical protein